MNSKLDEIFLNIRETIYEKIQEKQIDIDILTFNLGVSRRTFVENFSERIDDFPFYLETLSLVENWEA